MDGNDNGNDTHPLRKKTHKSSAENVQISYLFFILTMLRILLLKFLESLALKQINGRMNMFGIGKTENGTVGRSAI